MRSQRFNYVEDRMFAVDEKVDYDTSVENISYLSVNVDTGSKTDNNEQIKFSIAPSDSYLLPCRSYIYVGGQLVKEDGTPYGVDPQGNYPDRVFVNNGFMF